MKKRIAGLLLLCILPCAHASAQTAAVTRGELEKTIYGSGTIEPLSQPGAYAQVDGTVLSTHVTMGDSVRAGDVLVENYFSLEDGGQVRVEPIARASIACFYQTQIQAESEEEAFANAYLELGLTPLDRITEKEIFYENDLYTVKIGYIVIETINM